ncbi:hypothetical protein SAMN02787118_117129, partial [Streptomyces mirabilis]
DWTRRAFGACRADRIHRACRADRIHWTLRACWTLRASRTEGRQGSEGG